MPVSLDTGELTGKPEVLASGGEMASAWAQPTLSPDGKAIAYVTIRTHYEILAQNVAPRGRPTEKPLGDRCGWSTCNRVRRAWWPSSRASIGAGTGSPMDGGSVTNVWVMELAGGPGRLLTNDAEGIGWPVWSPDGTRIGVEIMRRADSRVGWMPARGGPAHEIVSTPGQNWPHSFSPDRRRIALAGQRRGIWNVYWVPLDGGDEQRVTSYDSPAVYVRSPDRSPTSTRRARRPYG